MYFQPGATTQWLIENVGRMYPKSGGNRLGTHNSRSAAERQERAIYANK